jgi:pseudolysin
MDRSQRILALAGALLVGLPFAYGSLGYAATSVVLAHQNISILNKILSTPNAVNLKETSRAVDFKKTLHIRIQETYSGYPVWGADAVVHIPNGEGAAKSKTPLLTAVKRNADSYMNGTLYQNLSADLANTPAYVFGHARAQEALQYGINTYTKYTKSAGGNPEVRDQQSQLMVFIDENKKAHWAFKVSFLAAATKKGQIPSVPVYILDAASFQVYEQWNDMKTLETIKLEDTIGGGYGGNIKMGKLTYDGLANDLPALKIKRDAAKKLCYLQNEEVTINTCTFFFPMFGCMSSTPFKVSCDVTDSVHGNVYWNGETDAINGGYSPSNDALYSGAVIKAMYQKWFHVPVLVNRDGSDMMLNMVVHLPQFDNAYWYQGTMNFGDGDTLFYPLTSLGVAAHEVSHGFTEQPPHSGLVYDQQSGGMNESFSDMAAQVAEIYAYGHNSWQIGPEIFKQEGQALRYMDQPSKDCVGGRIPAEKCSFEHVSDYDKYVEKHRQDDPQTRYPNVHYSSGIYNYVFYLISKAWGAEEPNKNEGVKKAFRVMLQANSHYWTSTTTFAEGACGVMKATNELGYDINAVKAAFSAVGITDTSSC